MAVTYWLMATITQNLMYLRAVYVATGQRPRRILDEINRINALRMNTITLTISEEYTSTMPLYPSSFSQVIFTYRPRNHK